MQSLVTIALRVLDPVPDAVRLVAVEAGDDGEYVVAHVTLALSPVRTRSEDYPESIEVIDLVEGDILCLHLVPYRIRALQSLADDEVEPGLLQGLVDRLDELVDMMLLP